MTNKQIEKRLRSAKSCLKNEFLIGFGKGVYRSADCTLQGDNGLTLQWSASWPDQTYQTIGGSVRAFDNYQTGDFD